MKAARSCLSLLILCGVFFWCIFGAIYRNSRQKEAVPQAAGKPKDRSVLSESFRLAPIAKRLVASTLRFPDTADWTDDFGKATIVKDWTESGPDPDHVTVSGRVQAKNAFGVPSTHRYSVAFDRTIAITLKIDGRDYDLLAETPGPE